MSLFRKKRKKRVCVIGLDGVPFPMIHNLAQKNVMPTFSNLIQLGHLHKMKASLPEISSVSWTDFMTGKNSGTHGIFGFTDLVKNSYDLRFPNFLEVKTETFWDKLAKKGKKSIIINQPSTYPARKINGKLISGFVAIELSKAVYPPSIKPLLEKIKYQIDIDTFRARENHEFLWKELEKTLVSREKAFDLFWKQDWDYFEFVITGTDRLMHFLWDAYQDEAHPYHEKFLEYYRKVDQLVGKIISSFQKTTGGHEGLYLLSDHGFTGIKQEVYLNSWLKKNGYINFETDSPQKLSEMTRDSIAFAMDPNRIYINLKNKFPKGKVRKSEKQALKNEIKKKLKNLNYEGEEVIEKISDTEDIYSGPEIPNGPDLIVVSKHGYDMKGSIKREEIFGRSNLKGMHTWDKAFFWATKEKSSDLCISDIAEIILEDFD
jgi:predicted AlkP superfamily phosphohydrolase/phosphomutase